MLRFPWRRTARVAPCAGPITVVLQATGSHAWAVSGGWADAARKLGVLGGACAPKASWGAPDVEDDGGLSAYLRRAHPGEVMLLLGFDWHSQALHTSPRWRRRFRRSAARKLLYVHESISCFRRLTDSDSMEVAFRSAAELADAVLYADVADRTLVESSGKPSLWQPFGVDVDVFRPDVPYDARAARAFFRGKVDPLLGHDSEYAARRRLLERLRDLDLVDLVPYAPGPVEAARIAADFGRYRVAVNLPSVFAGHPTRVIEGMACGCSVVTNRTGIPEVDALFADGVDVVYYDDERSLVDAVQRLTSDRVLGAAIAARGRRTAEERFALTRLLDEALRWAGRVVSPGVRSG